MVLYRYAQYEGRDVSRRADLGAYKDGAKVSSWAKDAMSWAVAEGLITGSNQKNLTPGGSTNRAQLAAIFNEILCLKKALPALLVHKRHPYVVSFYTGFIPNCIKS